MHVHSHAQTRRERERGVRYRTSLRQRCIHTMARKKEAYHTAKETYHAAKET